MTAKTDRITLALAACEGLTNEELAYRGAGSFAKMIDRKRVYAAEARSNAVAVAMLKVGLMTCKTIIAKLQDDIAKAQRTIETLESYDGQIVDTSEAREMLDSILKKNS